MKVTCLTVATLLLIGCVRTDPAIDATAPGELSVQVAISDDPQFSQKWIASAPSSEFMISRLNEVYPGQAAYIGFLISGHTARPDDRPDVVVSAIVRTPDGTVLFNMADGCAVRYPTGTGGFVIADPAIEIRFDETDPPSANGSANGVRSSFVASPGAKEPELPRATQPVALFPNPESRAPILSLT